MLTKQRVILSLFFWSFNYLLGRHHPREGWKEHITTQHFLETGKGRNWGVQDQERPAQLGRQDCAPLGNLLKLPTSLYF